MGRIPIVIHSDAKLPLENEIIWKNHAVLAHKNNVIDSVLTFHNSLSNEELIAIQKSNRDLMLTQFLRVNYFHKIHQLENEL